MENLVTFVVNFAETFTDILRCYTFNMTANKCPKCISQRSPLNTQINFSKQFLEDLIESIFSGMTDSSGISGDVCPGFKVKMNLLLACFIT